MLIAEFPQSRFKFRIYDNPNKKSWQTIKSETGCYALINLGYFSFATFKPDDALMVAGTWLQKPSWAYDGILIDEAGTLTVGPTTAAVYDYANGEPVYKLNGADYPGASAFGRDGNTMLGVTPDGTVVLLLCSKDEGQTSTEGVKALEAKGCCSIVRFDGSWSSQGSLGTGLDVDPSQERKVRSYLLVFQRDEDGNKEDKPVGEITQAIMTSSACYKAGRTITPTGIMVHSTGTPGAMADQLRASWDNAQATAAVHAIIDEGHTLMTLPWSARGWHAGTGFSGKTANDTHISFEVCEPDECRLLSQEWVPIYRGGTNPTWAVTRLQLELQARGYDPQGIDGSFGPGCEAALKAYQADAGLEADGSCGPATRAALADREGSYLSYNPEDTAAYFEAVWARAVALCAYLCKENKLDPETDILCHAEGYRQGIASNHADVEHWFPKHGKTMDQFRAAVKAAMGGESSQPEPQEPEQTWYTDAQTFVTSLGIADGTRPLDNVTRAEVWVQFQRFYQAIKAGK